MWSPAPLEAATPSGPPCPGPSVQVAEAGNRVADFAPTTVGVEYLGEGPRFEFERPHPLEFWADATSARGSKSGWPAFFRLMTS